MRYEVYGATSTFGALLAVGAFYSRVAAYRAVESEINSTVYPRFVILETPRKTAVPIGVSCGMTTDGFSTVARATYVYRNRAPDKNQILNQDYLRELTHSYIV